MANGIRTSDPCRSNKGRSSKFRVGSRVRQTLEEGRGTCRPKLCVNKDEDSSPKTLNDKNLHASSKKIQTAKFVFFFCYAQIYLHIFSSKYRQEISLTLALDLMWVLLFLLLMRFLIVIEGLVTVFIRRLFEFFMMFVIELLSKIEYLCK